MDEVRNPSEIGIGSEHYLERDYDQKDHSLVLAESVLNKPEAGADQENYCEEHQPFREMHRVEEKRPLLVFVASHFDVVVINAAKQQRERLGAHKRQHNVVHSVEHRRGAIGSEHHCPRHRADEKGPGHDVVNHCQRSLRTSQESSNIVSPRSRHRLEGGNRAAIGD